MFLKLEKNGHLVEVVDIQALFDPFASTVGGRLHVGEDPPPDEERFAKTDLIFPSGERLPRCWTDPHYHDRAFVRA